MQTYGKYWENGTSNCASGLQFIALSFTSAAGNFTLHELGPNGVQNIGVPAGVTEGFNSKQIYRSANITGITMHLCTNVPRFLCPDTVRAN
jgi:hypothetical protein